MVRIELTSKTAYQRINLVSIAGSFLFGLCFNLLYSLSPISHFSCIEFLNQTIKNLNGKAEKETLLYIFILYLSGVAPLLNFIWHLTFNSALIQYLSKTFTEVLLTGIHINITLIYHFQLLY